MEWNSQTINTVLQEMIQENPLACRALLNICEVKFTQDVETLSISMAKDPVLFINLDFCNKYLKSDNNLKAVLLHEFLHVLLQHTEKYECNSFLLNLCLDAIINAIIYRMQGMEYADFFVRYYEWKIPFCLLRPQATDATLKEEEWQSIHEMIYQGRFAGDQLLELLEYLMEQQIPDFANSNQFIGTHHAVENPSENVKKILKEIVAKMQGVKLWSKHKFPGLGSAWEHKHLSTLNQRNNKLRMEVLQVIRQCLLPTAYKKIYYNLQTAVLPYLSVSDKRSMAKLACSKLLPYSTIELQSEQLHPKEKFQLYLDVSGSMEQELNQVMSVISHFTSYISSPVWAFSNDVKPAEFKDGKLCYETSYGTGFRPVLEHYHKHRFKKALIITDGYFEAIEVNELASFQLNGLRALVTSHGSVRLLEKMAIPFIQLSSTNNQ